MIRNKKSMTMVSPLSAEFVKGLTLFLCFWYVGLCFLHWLGQRPLWLDEFNVFLSVRDFSLHQFFTQKLAGGQIFPKLYLFLVQQVSKPFHFQILSLRFLSFLAMVLAFGVWMGIARREWQDPVKSLMYALSWSGTTLLIYYAAELKPYSMDVLVAGLFVAFIIRMDDWRVNRPQRYFWGIMVLPLLGAVSYPAYLFYIFLIFNHVRSPRHHAGWGRDFIVMMCSMALAVGWIYYFDIRLAHANAASQGFDDYAISFVSVGEFFKSFWEGTVNLFCRYFAERPRIYKKMAMPLGILALVYMFGVFFKSFVQEGYRFSSVRTMALVLYVQLFILGALQKYPFSVPRTSLFFCPIVLMFIIDAITSIQKKNEYVYLGFMAFYILFLIVLTFGLGQTVCTGNLGFAGPSW